LETAGDEAGRAREFPASFAQQRLWFLDRLEPNSALYNVPVAMHLSGRLDPPALERALREIVARHEVLRTTFDVREGQLMQVVSPEPRRLELPVVELDARTPQEVEAVAGRMATEEASHPFDLARGPLLRARLLRFGEDEHVLLLTMHHIVSDGWSVTIIFNELSELYAAFSRGQESPLAALPIQYADYAVWQRERLRSDVLEGQLKYWRGQLGGEPLPALKIGSRRAARASYRGGQEVVELGEGLRRALQRRCKEQRVTLYMLLLAAFDVLLYRYTGEKDVVVGTPIANRLSRKAEGLIGFFVNTLVLRVKVEGRESFAELLSRVRSVALDAYDHQEMPFEKLVEALQPERSAGHLPLFQVMFVLQNTPKPVLHSAGLTFRELPVELELEKADLTLGVIEHERGLTVGISYRKDLFEPTLVRQMLRHYRTLLEGVARDPFRGVSELPLFDEGELRRMLAEWNDTACEYPSGRCVQHLFEERVARAPEAVAVVFEDEQLSYGELNGRANRIARYLRKAGVGPETRVGVMLERGPSMIESVLGVLKAGGCYVPLDAQLPRERLAYMLEDAGAAVLLTERKPAEQLGDATGVRVICLDLVREQLAAESAENFESGATADNLAYVIYTSGSTGRPKGVMVEHRSLCNMAVAQADTFGLGAEDRVLQFASLSFDASIFEIVAALYAGAALCLVARETLLGGPDFIRFLRERGVTFTLLPPSVLGVLPGAELPDLKTLCVGGAPCPAEVLARWSKARRFFNLYGPTEATVYATAALCADDGQPPPIGRPIFNTQAYLLDADLKPVPVGAVGEIYLAGVGLARGYLNHPALTAERFIPNPFGNATGARLYRTGDLARYLPEGEIEFVGRVDSQLKIRGFRVELGEIESVLGVHPSVRQATVFEREAPNGEMRLAAYLLPREGEAPDVSELRDYLSERLPAYMIPSAFVFVNSFPLTVSGKIDARSLPQPIWTPAVRETGRAAPRNTREEALIEMWEGLLGTKGIGIRDNFFEFGGNSILMMQAIAQTNEAFDVNLPVAAFYESPTIEAIADIILKLWRAPMLEEASEVFDANMQARPAPIFALQPVGSKPPFFCVHPVGGHLGDYRELARELAAYDQPVYGLQAWGLDEDAEPSDRVEEMAASYAEAVLSVQPRGPFRLGGYCSGGVLALEVARELRRRGHEVSLLALLGAQPNLANSAALDEIMPNFDLFSSVFFGDELKITLTHEALRPLGREERMEKIWEEFCRQSPVDSARLGKTIFRRLYKVYMANMRATANYTPRPFDGRVALFESAEQQAKHERGSDWEGFCRGPLERHRLEGNHITLMRRPHVRELAKRLNACLNGEEAAAPAGV
jgi:amino acid adenylation domain-containing protein